MKKKEFCTAALNNNNNNTLHITRRYRTIEKDLAQGNFQSPRRGITKGGNKIGLFKIYSIWLVCLNLLNYCKEARSMCINVAH